MEEISHANNIPVHAHMQPEGRNWLSEYRVVDVVSNRLNNEWKPAVELDADYVILDDIPGLKTTLYPHQKTIVKAMVDLEIKRVIKASIACTSGAGSINNEEHILTCSAAVLSDPVGSGKTIDILAVILLQKFPNKIADITQVVCEVDLNKGYRGVIRQTYNNILNPTLIFVGSSVFAQWIQAIQQFTDLRYLVIDDVRKLEKMLEMVINREINRFDIILVKNGKVTRITKTPPEITLEKKNLIKTASIYNIVANLRQFCWARVVVDDFDTLGIPKNASMINGIMTWFISSTTKLMRSRQAIENNNIFYTTEDYLNAIDYQPASILSNPLLFSAFNLRNTTDFIKQSNNVPKIVFYIYKFADPVGQYANMLNALGEEGKEIVEMLNSDAPATAAEKAGIKSTSVADIFQQMLGKHYQMWISSKNILEFIEVEYNKSRMSYKNNPDQTDTYGKKDLINLRPILWQYRGLTALFEETKKEYIEKHENAGMAIQRVKDNIKEGSCPVCFNDLASPAGSIAYRSKNQRFLRTRASSCEAGSIAHTENKIGQINEKEEADEISDIPPPDDIVIFKCCGIVICSVCCFGIIFAKAKLSGNCANCRAVVNIKDIIYISNTFDISNIINNNLSYSEKKEEKIVESAVQNEKNEKSTNPLSKVDCLLDIINGKSINNRKKVNIAIKHLMKGNIFKPITNEVKKVLVFSNYNECLNQIREVLTNNNILFYKLDGSQHRIRNIVETFKKEQNTAVLLINSIEHCSGLNLQFATDLVFMHLMNDKNIESQVLGRGQRLSRTCSLSVHYLLYTNELSRMEANGSIEANE